MIQAKLTLINALGLHARASAKLVACCSRYLSQVRISTNSKSANGKSIMAVMLLGATVGTELEIEVEGPDEQELLQAISELVQRRFYEEA